MPTGRTCGNCKYFQRVKDWGVWRNGLCDKTDYNCHSDSSYAKRCPYYESIRYKRNKEELVREIEREDVSPTLFPTHSSFSRTYPQNERWGNRKKVGNAKSIDKSGIIYYTLIEVFYGSSKRNLLSSVRGFTH